MAESLFSPHWYRVSDLRPALQDRAQVHRHHHGDETWWVIDDALSGRQHRVAPGTWQLISQMDGRTSLQDIWAKALADMGEAAPSQQETIQLLAQLHTADLLSSNATPDVLELLQRQQRRTRASLRQRFLNPVFMRFRLFDPDALLVWLLPVFRFAFSRGFVAIWLLLVVLALALVGANWAELGHDVRQQFLTPGNVVLLWLVFPVLKVLHELGHGLAVRRWGGEVHELGIMLLVLLPVPYVDASAASAYPDVRRRVVVGVAGVLVESLLAACAVFVWLLVEPGLVRQVAMDVMVVGGVSAVLFNGNPLLKFDAYYVLTDLAGLPNLATRSRAYLGHLFNRMLFGAVVSPPDSSRRERIWFVVWGVSAFCCRIAILAAVVLYLAGKMFVLGVVLAGWTLVTQLGLPMVRSLGALRASPWWTSARWRALGTGAGLMTAAALLLFVVPLPAVTLTHGVVWLDDDAMIRAGTGCFIESLAQGTGDPVQLDTPVAHCLDHRLPHHIRSVKAGITSLQHEYNGYALRDQVRRSMLADDIAERAAELAHLQQREQELVLRSGRAGVLLLPDEADLVGRYLAKGDVLGMVLDAGALRVRVVLEQSQRGRVLEQLQGVSLVFAATPTTMHASRILSMVPASNRMLPSAALGAAGGGDIAVDPEDPAGRRALADVFMLDLEVPDGVQLERVGGRVWVRFDHSAETLAAGIARATRLLFLRQFDV